MAKQRTEARIETPVGPRAPTSAFSEVQLSLLEDDVVELELKSPTASGQRVVHLHPVRFLRRLAWLIPPPKQNQVRYYGVFAPTHGLRAQVLPKKVRDDGDEDADEAGSDDGANRHRVDWALPLRTVWRAEFVQRDLHVEGALQEPLPVLSHEGHDVIGRVAQWQYQRAFVRIEGVPHAPE